MNGPALISRLPRETVRELAHGLDFERLGLHALEALPSPLLLVNRTQQIVFANRAVRDLTSDNPDRLLGLRTGEAFRCENASLAEGGCGCAETCRTCGALMVVQQGLEGSSCHGECRMTCRGTNMMEALDLRVSAQPLICQGESYVLIHFADISDEKRRQNLEKIFFHDVLNVAGSIRGFSEILLDYDLKNPREVMQQLHEAAQQMIDEVEAQRLLTRAESGDLTVQREPLESSLILERVATLLKGHEVARGRRVAIADQSERQIFLSDATLLVRSLFNLGKNALEASAQGETVSMSCTLDGRILSFHVHNPAVIPSEVQLQIFQRSFSTRGAGRGIGTYSVRLLVERYLAGEVAFVSDHAAGTRFTISLHV